MKPFARAALITFAVLLGTPGGRLLAQNNNSLMPGDRIRFTLTDVQSPGAWESRRMLLKGTVLEARKDSLIIQIGGDATRLAMSRLALGDLSVSRGTERGWKTHPGRTAVQGVMTALTIGLVVQSATRRYHSTTTTHNSVATAERGAQTMLGVTAVLQTSIFVRTATAKTEKWERVR